jgi:hypothetical protein
MVLCSKHTKTPKKLKPRKYPQKRKLFSKDTIKRLNKIQYCQNITHKGQKCNLFIPVGSPERQKHHIIPLSKGGTNNFRNIMVCCIDCHYALHREAFEEQGLSLQQFRAQIYRTFRMNRSRKTLVSSLNVGRRGLGYSFSN